MSNHPSSLKALPEPDVLESLPTQLARLYHGFVALVDRLGADSSGRLPNFRPGAGSVYFTLLRRDACTARDLVEALKIPKATISGLLDGLERDGVIERSPCVKDGRSQRLRLTPFGRSLEVAFCERHQRAVSILEEGLTTKEAAVLRQTLRRVLGNLDRIREQGLEPAPKPRKTGVRRAA